MAFGKRVKTGGSYYKGYVCAVATASASYTIYIDNTENAAMSGISFIPDGYGVGDTMSLIHYDSASGAGNVSAILAEDLYNLGQAVPVSLEFPAFEIIDSAESLKFTYLNTASVPMNVYIVVEYVGIKKKA